MRMIFTIACATLIQDHADIGPVYQSHYFFDEPRYKKYNFVSPTTMIILYFHLHSLCRLKSFSLLFSFVVFLTFYSALPLYKI